MNQQLNFQETKFFIGSEDGNVSGEPISIYDLADKALAKEGSTSIDNGFGESVKTVSVKETPTIDGEVLDRLSTAKLGNYTYKADDGRDVEKKNVMIYKYLFKCENMEYNLSNGRVKSLKFTAYVNPNYPG